MMGLVELSDVLAPDDARELTDGGGAWSPQLAAPIEGAERSEP
jgi:hypothetical protein